jgi:hypothetical protein
MYKFETISSTGIPPDQYKFDVSLSIMIC